MTRRRYNDVINMKSGQSQGLYSSSSHLEPLPGGCRRAAALAGGQYGSASSGARPRASTVRAGRVCRGRARRRARGPRGWAGYRRRRRRATVRALGPVPAAQAAATSPADSNAGLWVAGLC